MDQSPGPTSGPHLRCQSELKPFYKNLTVIQLQWSDRGGLSGTSSSSYHYGVGTRLPDYGVSLTTGPSAILSTSIHRAVLDHVKKPKGQNGDVNTPLQHMC